MRNNKGQFIKGYMGGQKLIQKSCKRCGKLFSKSFHYSYKQWEKQEYCSRVCSAINTHPIGRKVGKYKTRCDIGKKGGKLNLTDLQRKEKKERTEKLWKIDEYRQKNIISHIGIKQSKQTIEKRVSNFRDKSPLWKGGVTPINEKIRKSWKYKIWRKSIFEKYNYTCQVCAARNGQGKTVILHAHHIKSFPNYTNLRFETDNGYLLCKDCHKKTNNYGNKNYGQSNFL